jgi:hypothetical protein
VRNEAFLVRDPGARKDLYDNQVHLYNPREDAVPLDRVKDVFLDFGYFMDVDQDGEDLRALRRELTERIGVKEAR